MEDGESKDISLHDGSRLSLKKLNRDYDPKDKQRAVQLLQEAQKTQTLVTGLLYFQPDVPDLGTRLNLGDTPLHALTEKELVPGAEPLRKINNSFK